MEYQQNATQPEMIKDLKATAVQKRFKFTPRLAQNH